MKRIIGLLAMMVLMSCFLFTGVALAGVDFTLEFSRDFDALEISGFSELVLSGTVAPLDFSLTHTHDFLPEEADKLEGSIGLTLGPLSFGYERELIVYDPGVGIVDLAVGLISFGYEYEFNVDESGKLTVILEKSI